LSQQLEETTGEGIPFMMIGPPTTKEQFAKLEKAVEDSIATGKDLLGEDEYYGYNNLVKEGCLS
jgi:hypothetical protein